MTFDLDTDFVSAVNWIDGLTYLRGLSLSKIFYKISLAKFLLNFQISNFFQISMFIQKFYISQKLPLKFVYACGWCRWDLIMPNSGRHKWYMYISTRSSSSCQRKTHSIEAIRWASRWVSCSIDAVLHQLAPNQSQYALSNADWLKIESSSAMVLIIWITLLWCKDDWL